MTRLVPIHSRYLHDVPASGQHMHLLHPRNFVRNKSHRLVVLLHDFGGSDHMADVNSGPYDGIGVYDGFRRTAGALAASGYVVATPTTYDLSLGETAHTWGNDESLDQLTDAVDYLQGVAGWAKIGRVGFIGYGMGHLTGFNFVVRNPTRASGFVGVNPIVDFLYSYNDGVDASPNGFPTLINEAYGLATGPNSGVLDTTVQAERDPYTRASDLYAVGIPYYLYYNEDDQVTGLGREEIADNYLGITSASYVTGPDLFDHDLWPLSEQSIAAWTVRRVNQFLWG